MIYCWCCSIVARKGLAPKYSWRASVAKPTATLIFVRTFRIWKVTMASKPASRSLQSITRRVRTSCQCSSSTSSRSALVRQFSASPSRPEVQYETDKAERPRWSYTPENMKAPFPTKIKDPEMAWECNSDPKRLDQFYIKFLGRGGDTVLTEEVKWLAITHKSYDQGRRGFNDRLAFFGMFGRGLHRHDILSNLGRRILNLQTTLALLHSPIATKTQSLPDPNDDREPYTHPALEGLANLTDVPIGEVLTRKRLAGLATQVGMREILRWKPRLVSRLIPLSGQD